MLTVGQYYFRVGVRITQDTQWIQGKSSVLAIRGCAQFEDEPQLSGTIPTIKPFYYSVYHRPEVADNRTTTSLTEALSAFVKQLELSSVAEINQECLAFLKDCISNTTTYKNLYGNLLATATVYGEKLDDCVISDKKKMRKDFGVQCLFDSWADNRKFTSNCSRLP